MTEKEFTKKLKRMQQVEMDSEQKEEVRNVLWNKIAADGFNYSSLVSRKEKIYARIFGLCKKLSPASLKKVPHSALMVGVVVFVLIGGVITVEAAEDAKPGSPLYFARIIKEKAQLATTFDEEKKAKLGAKFASNHAKDISQVLNSKEFRNNSTPEEARRLSRDFEENIRSVKMNLQEIKGEQNSPKETEEKTEKKGKESNDSQPEEKKQPQENENQPQPQPQPQKQTEQKQQTSQEASDDQNQNKNQSQDPDSEGEEFFSVESSKQDKGVQVYDPAPEKEETADVSLQSEEEQDDKEKEKEDNSGAEEDTSKGTSSQATSSNKTSTTSKDSSISQKLEDAEEIVRSEDNNGDKLEELLIQAEELLEQEKYDEALKIYEEILETSEKSSSIIDSEDSSQDEEEEQEKEVKGDSEEATSTSKEEGSTASTSASSTPDSE